MALTFKEIWSRYSQFEIKRRMFVKRLRRDGIYEDDWQEISQGKMQDGSISRIQRSLPNSSYQFGKLQVANANMRIMSAFREFADEGVSGSIFRGFVRHWSKIKVEDSIIDKYSGLKRVLQIDFDGTDGQTTYTAETGQVVTFFGNAQLDTSEKYSGQSSLLLDGTGDYTTIPSSQKFDFGTGNFKIKVKVFNNGGTPAGSAGIISAHDFNTVVGWHLYLNSLNRLEFAINGGARSVSSTVAFPAGWVNIKVIRKGGILSLYQNDDLFTATNLSGYSVDSFSGVDIAVGRSYVNRDDLYWDGWIDKPEIFKEDVVKSNDEETVISFQGLIDAKTATTEQDFEAFTALDFITVLDQINVTDLSLTETTLNDLVYEAMNRDEFTKYFSVSSDSAYIDAGYNVTSIDTSEYEGSVLDMLQDLATGHSIFFINPDDGFFYFKEAIATTDLKFSFLEQNNRKLSILQYREGRDRQITGWYWEGSDPIISAIASGEAAPITETFSIKGVTAGAQQQLLLNFVLGKTRTSKPYFKLELPFFPIVKILDRIQIQAFGSASKDAIRWGMFIWTAGDTSTPEVAPRWTKATGIKISEFDRWMVRSITHDKNLKTTLEVESIS